MDKNQSAERSAELLELLSGSGLPYNIIVTGDELERFINEKVEKEVRRRTLWADEYLPGKSAAELCNVSLNTITNWAKRGILPKYKMGGRTFYRRGDLTALVKSERYGKDKKDV